MEESFVVTEATSNMRLDKLITERQEGKSRHMVQNLIKEGFVLVNGVPKKANYKCKENDLITWDFPAAKEMEPIEAEDLPLDIIYEDDYLLIINKPKGMIVHPAATIQSGTLVNALLFHVKQLSNLSGDTRPGIVHRLDQDTSGLMIIAKTNDVHHQLKEQFQARTVKRIYEAVVKGQLKNDKGIIRAPIGRDPKNRLQMTVIASGREAETHFEVKDYVGGLTIVQCQLITGRTHQIRVHMKYIGHPIVGDKVYGVKGNKQGAKGQALFAKAIGFHHPITKEWMEFQIERPPYIENILDHIKDKS